MDKKYYNRAETDLERMFYCSGGFGCSPDTSGRAIFGHFTIDAEEVRVEGYQVKRLATEKEIAQAKFPHPLTEQQKAQAKIDRWQKDLEMLDKEKANIVKRISDEEKRLKEL